MQPDWNPAVVHVFEYPEFHLIHPFLLCRCNTVRRRQSSKAGLLQQRVGDGPELRNVDRAAERIGREDSSLEVRDRLDWAVDPDCS